MGKRVTILDVAAAAGVSRQTVTRAINDMGDISEPTKRKVLAAAERLGYRPSRFARSLVTRQKTHAVGLVVASLRNPYFTDIAADMLSEAAARKWQLMIAASERDSPELLQLLSTQVDVIVGHFGLPDAEIRDAAQGLPIVLLEGRSDLPGVHSVEVDIESGIGDAVSALRARGARRFGMVDSAYSERIRGAYEPTPKRQWFEAAVGDGLAGVVVGEESISGGGRAFAELMRLHPDIDAVLMFNDLMALGAVQSAHAIGIAVPGDVRIIGVDGLALGDAVDPPLTTISLDQQSLASNTLDIVEIIAKADFARIAPIHRTVRSKVLWRESA
ncbi:MULTISPECIES: LacI family DNA-binding transcriptional regulator [Glycomyces]|uniref:LacI family DNA-binding transcriptional regulator n=2 Tax=Glycomyces TaxID=58113 RepID=A0A9X3PKZ3_9ACTN|nr:LacI family DNA-binding transcriptional regulator [Glycomyces lechevalierae]MDA1385970.1 LacI family DNA-binding transcriptional regulator [Glycomyces lechevalierae]MDR7340873.1 LacI family transcriptional regulator [Glycomyces lechevalierae]